MKITYKKEQPKKIRTLNLYAKESGKNIDTDSLHFLNFEIPKKLTRRSFRIFVRGIIKRAKSHKIEKLAIQISQISSLKIDDLAGEMYLREFVIQADAANYYFDTYLTEKKKGVRELIFIGDISAKEKQSIKDAQIIAASVEKSRILANTPGGRMTPQILGAEAKKMFKGKKSVTVKFLEEKDLKRLKMNLMLAVGQGSVEKSKLIIAEYNGGSKTQKPIVLLGKGITFDTGGLNLKPGASMDEMAMDMTGGATALCALDAISSLGIKKNVVVLVPAVENAISGSAYRPGDIIRSMSGKTVQIGNTDAEGRLVLADSITYAKKYKPSVLIDIATLTGAAVVAVGERASVVMTKERELEDTMRDLGEQTGDYVWPLPTWEEYEQEIKAPYADLLNIGKTRWGGAITAGMFLAEFAKDLPDTKWVHLDIAPRMEPTEGDNLEKGSTGEPVKLLVEFVKSYK